MLKMCARVICRVACRGRDMRDLVRHHGGQFRFIREWNPGIRISHQILPDPVQVRSYDGITNEL
jgi:hypothetical protein